MRLNIAVFAPIPKPRIRTAVMVKPGDFRSRRSVWRTGDEVIGDWWSRSIISKQ
jgi:hypothetical protein